MTRKLLWSFRAYDVPIELTADVYAWLNTYGNNGDWIQPDALVEAYEFEGQAWLTWWSFSQDSPMCVHCPDCIQQVHHTERLDTSKPVPAAISAARIEATGVSESCEP